MSSPAWAQDTAGGCECGRYRPSPGKPGTASGEGDEVILGQEQIGF